MNLSDSSWDLDHWRVVFCCLGADGRYLTAAKQAVFTGKQQRDGVAALPFIVPGLFALADAPWAPTKPALDACTRGSGPPQLIVSDDGDDNGSDADCDADDEVEAGNVDSSAGFNWAAYREVWHDTSFDRAVTALFAEYASPYSRMSGQARSCVPPPMTLGRGLSISEQASRFLTLYFNRILGAIHSTKVHKLLCRIMSAIRWHGDFQNGNTADNDSQHKLDKPFYSRTNKHLTDYTRQLVLRARGAQAVLRRLDEVDGRAGSSGSRRGLRHRDTPSGAHDAPPAAPPHGVSAAERPQRVSSAYHL